jgi:hypothetical protein
MPSMALGAAALLERLHRWRRARKRIGGPSGSRALAGAGGRCDGWLWVAVGQGYGHSDLRALGLAVALYQRAAEQGNVEALLNVGDAFYYGRGTRRDWQRAAEVYLEAGRRRNAQAYFNLGWMHEYGAGLDKASPCPCSAPADPVTTNSKLHSLGSVHGAGAERTVPTLPWLPRSQNMHAARRGLSNAAVKPGVVCCQDLHLAKRYYDKAMEVQPDAWVPVRLALLSLGAHGMWESLLPWLPSSWTWLRTHVFAIADSEQGAVSRPRGRCPRLPSSGIGQRRTLALAQSATPLRVVVGVTGIKCPILHAN